MFPDLALYAVSVVDHWGAFVGGGILALITYFIDRMLPRWQAPKSLYAAILLAGLMIAGFQAWREEHSGAETAKKEAGTLAGQLAESQRQATTLRDENTSLRLKLASSPRLRHLRDSMRRKIRAVGDFDLGTEPFSRNRCGILVARRPWA